MWKIGQRKWRVGLRWGLDLLYPRQCLVRGDSVDADSPFRYLGSAAARQIILAEAPFCPTCGHPYWGAAEEDQVCPHCRELDPVFGEGRTLALMRGPARELLIELKYHRGLHVLEDIAALAERVPGYLSYLSGATLVPVPLHPKKQKVRGFNQSERIARVLARRCGGTDVRCLLRRVRNTVSQTRLPRKERQANMRGAFALHPSARVEAGRRLVLLDDVFTTGATLNACAALLKAEGASRVDVATICHG